MPARSLPFAVCLLVLCSSFCDAENRFPRPLTQRGYSDAFEDFPTDKSSDPSTIHDECTRLLKNGQSGVDPLFWKIESSDSDDYRYWAMTSLDRLRLSDDARIAFAAVALLESLRCSGHLSVSIRAARIVGPDRLEHMGVARQIVNWCISHHGAQVTLKKRPGWIFFGPIAARCSQLDVERTIRHIHVPDQIPVDFDEYMPVELHIPKHADISDQIVESLKKLTTLKKIVIASNTVPDSKLAELQVALPKCAILVPFKHRNIAK